MIEKIEIKNQGGHIPWALTIHYEGGSSFGCGRFTLKQILEELKAQMKSVGIAV